MASARPGASRRLRAMLYPVAGWTRFAAAPNAVTAWCATGRGPPTGMYDHSSSMTRVTCERRQGSKIAQTKLAASRLDALATGSRWGNFGAGPTVMPLAASRRCRRRFSTAKGRAGLATRHVSSRNTRRPPSMGIAYRNDGTSDSLPQRPSPAFGCVSGPNLQRVDDQGAHASVRRSLTHRSNANTPAGSLQPWQSFVHGLCARPSQQEASMSGLHRGARAV